MARKKADPILEDSNVLEENSSEMEMMQTGAEDQPDFNEANSVLEDLELFMNGLENRPGESEGLVSADAEGTEWAAAAFGDPESENTGEEQLPSDGDQNRDAEQGDSAYGDILNEVSSLGLNNEGDAPPLTLSESGDNGNISGGDDEDAYIPETVGDQTEADDRPESGSRPRKVPRRDRRILTIDAHDEVLSEEEQEATRWHDVQNAYRTRKILTGTLDSVERTENGMTVAVVSYDGYRVAIPLKEMNLYKGRMPSGREYDELMVQLNRNLNARLGSEIDFMVKGIENKSRSIVASRKDAMYRKRQTFFFDPSDDGEPMIYEGRVVQARVVAVAEKLIRVEVFGVECTIRAPGMSCIWIGNARDHYNVGDRVLVRILRISKPSVEDLKVDCDIRSVSSVTSADNLSKCVVQGRYAGKVTGVRGGVVYIRLNNGVNAVAHSCYDARTPGKKDDVSFAVTRLDAEQGVAHGLITRIIRQNI